MQDLSAMLYSQIHAASPAPSPILLDIILPPQTILIILITSQDTPPTLSDSCRNYYTLIVSRTRIFDRIQLFVI